MTEAPGGSAGFGHGSDPEEHEALLRRIREFLRHGAAAEAGVEEWGEFAAQLRFLREELATHHVCARGLLCANESLHEVSVHDIACCHEHDPWRRPGLEPYLAHLAELVQQRDRACR